MDLNLELNIEELVLRGIKPNPNLVSEIEEELQRLLREEGVPEALKYGDEICIDSKDVDLGSNPSNQAADRIARVVYRSLSNGK
jgi:hypothetical protein